MVPGPAQILMVPGLAEIPTVPGLAETPMVPGPAGVEPTVTWSDHRVATVEVARVSTRYPRTVGRNARLGSHGAGPDQTVVRVRTDQGGQGWGLVAGDLAGVTALVGRRIDELFDPAVGVVEAPALPLDFALHDLAGRLLGQPVHQLLGGRGSRAVPCYDGAIYFDDLDPDDAPRGIEAVLANCQADHALGFRAFKLKIGRGHRWMPPDAGRRRDIEVTRAVRAAFPDCSILVDANDGYTGPDVLDYLDAVADCEVFWLEEPFTENHADLSRLREHLRRCGSSTLVADGEHDPDIPFLLELGKEGLLDVLLMDVVSYGLTPWRALMPLLDQIGVRSSPHAWGLPLKSLYAAQMAAGLRNVVTVEGVPGTTDGVDTSAYRLRDGVLHVPDTPGFGLDLLVDTTPLS